LENRLHVESAQAIISSHKVPLDIAHSLGLTAHASTAPMMQHQNFSQSQSASPLNMNYQKHQQQQPFDHKSNIHHFHGINFGTMTQAAAPVPNTSSSLNTSPMHQITRGISGLTTNSSNEPLDLTMTMEASGSAVGEEEMDSNQWYDMRPLNLSTTCASSSTAAQAQQQRIMQATPPTSPSNNLCIIQEEHLPASSSHYYCAVDINAPHHHPQISLTDVQGSEITLVALSDSSSRDSDDSLDTNNSNETRRTMSTVTTPSGSTKGGISMFHEFLIKEPSHDMPSITRGVGRKASLENEYSKHHQQSSVNPASVKIVEAEQYARRGSDKSLGFSDDSLSNDSNQSPAQEISHSSGFKSTEERLSPDSLSESRGGSSDEYYELPLNEYQNLDASSIIEIVRKQIINSKIPPNRINQGGDCGDVTEDTNLSLEYSSGLQIELKICERQKSGVVEKAGPSSSTIAATAAVANTSNSGENTSKGIIKLRRISGDSTEYGKLCQQLLNQLTV
jgi:hypothetical protein